MYHVFLASEELNLLECSSDAADYDYYIQLKNADDIPKAMEIAETELTLWGGGYDELTDPYLYDYYYYSGYVEVVLNAFEKAGIEIRHWFDDDAAARVITTLLEGK